MFSYTPSPASAFPLVTTLFAVDLANLYSLFCNVVIL